MFICAEEKVKKDQGRCKGRMVQKYSIGERENASKHGISCADVDVGVLEIELWRYWELLAKCVSDWFCGVDFRVLFR